MIHTTYGKVLLAKIALISPLLAVAGLNAFILKPRLVDAIDGAVPAGRLGYAGSARALEALVAWLQRVLPWTIAVEVALIVAVFAAVGVLTQTSTAKGEVAQKLAAKAASTEVPADGRCGRLEAHARHHPEPRRAQPVRPHDRRTRTGRRAPTVTLARLRFTYDQVAGRCSRVRDDAHEVAPAAITAAQASYFSQPGNWRVQVDVRRSDGDDVSQQIVIAVARTRRHLSEPGDRRRLRPALHHLRLERGRAARSSRSSAR